MRFAPSSAAICALVVLAFAGCGGGDDAPAPAGHAQAEPGKTVVAALGDSIIAGSPLYDPDPERRRALGFGDDERSQLGYWAALEDPEIAVRNCGVFGERTDEIAARLDNCSEGADVLLVQGGINDIAQALGGGPDAAVSAARNAVENIDETIAEGQKYGLDVIVANVLPWNNGHPVADPAIAVVNEGIADIARRRDVPLLDFHAALEDPQNPGLMAPGLTDDGDHPSIKGYRILGKLLVREL